MNEITRALIIQILQILIQLIAVFLVPIIIKGVKTFNLHLEAQIGKANYEKYAAVVKDIVYAIEQQYPNMAGSEKYKSAVYAINEKLGNLLTQQETDTLIESAVASINLVTKGTIKPMKAEVKIETPIA